MSEVGDLRVKLSLDNAQFEKSVTSMNRTLQAMGQEIRGLQNKGKDWGASIDGLKQKQDAYSRLLEGQQTKVRKLADEYEKAKQETGEHSAQTEKLAVQLNKATAEMNRTETELSQITAELKRQEAELAKTQSSWYKFGEVAQQAGEKLKAVGDRMKDIGKELSMKITAPITALGVGATKAAIDFESAFAGVRKTVDASEEEFQALSDGIRDMAKRMPTAATEIATVGEAAGQLGIKKENILGFTETMVKLGTATNMGSDEAATALARLANITKMNQADFDKLGSSIVALGNNFATTESEITEMGLRLAGAGAQIGLSEADILGLSAALTSVGIQAEMGGSAFSRVMVNMQMATSGTEKFKLVSEKTGLSLRELQLEAGSGGKAFGEFAKSMGLTRKELSDIISTQSDLENFSKIAGMTADGFKKAFAEDAIGAIGAFVSGLGNAEEAGTTAINMLQEMGISEVQLRDALLRAGGAAELFGDAVKTSNEGWEENNALNKEAEERYKTTAAQLQILKNKIIDVAISFGDTLIPMMMSVVDKITPIIDKFSNLDESTRKLIVVIAGIAAAIGPVLVVIGMLVSSVGAISSALGGMSLAIANAGGVMAALKLALAAITGPVGLVVAGIVALGAAMIAAYANFDGFRDKVDSVFAGIKNIASNVLKTVVSFIKEQLTSLVTFWNQNGTQILQAVTNVFNGIKAVIDFVMPAIKFVIEMVWTAIKGIITGALDVIMGAIKVFSGLFTGDFSKMWEGIKQIFMGAIDLIIGWISLTFVGGLRTLVTNLGKTLFNVIKGMWDDIARVFSGSISNVVNFVKGFSTNVTSSFTNLYTKGINAFKELWRQSSTYTETLVNIVKALISTMRTTVINLVTSLKDGFIGVFRTMLSSVKTVVISIKDSIVNTIKGINLFQIGKDIIQGLINGIGSMGSFVLDKIKEIASGLPEWAKKVLGIHSPSRVFAQIGRWISEGWAIGIEEKGNMVQNAVNDIALNAKDIAEHYVSEEKKLRSKANADIAKIETDKATKIATIEKRMHEDVAKAQRAAASRKKKTTQDDALKIQRIKEDAKAKIVKLEETSSVQIEKIRTTSTKKIVGLESEMNKTLLEETKRYIDDRKSLDQLSIIEEAQVWEQSMKLFGEGTKERVKAQQEYKKATEVVNKEITAINTDFQGQINKVNEELMKQEETLTKAYEDAVDKRAKSLYSFKNLFDEFKVEIDTTGDQLLSNLGSQVQGFKEWQRQIELLSEKAIDKGLLAELREMGPNALPQLLALNSMTSSQLTQYSNLYKEKSSLARKQAETEMIGMKNDTDKQISELRTVANRQLDTLKNEWNAKIKSLTKTTSTELSSLKQIGRDAGNGLLEGLSSTQGALQRKAQDIADSISRTIQSALKIKSPSRVMMGFGENVGEGLIIGMEDKIKQVVNAGKKLASAVTQPMGDFGSTRGSFATQGGQSTTNNNYSAPVVVHLNYSGNGSTHDAMQMVDFVESELGSRLNSRLRMSGVKK